MLEARLKSDQPCREVERTKKDGKHRVIEDLGLL